MQLVRSSAVLEVPPSVRLCPYCGAKLSVTFSMWTQDSDGLWKAEDAELLCHNEPEDIDGDEWEDWLSVHSIMPYVYGLPAELDVLDWVGKNYRFWMREEK